MKQERGVGNKGKYRFVSTKDQHAFESALELWLAFSGGTGSKATTIMTPGGRIHVFVPAGGDVPRRLDWLGQRCLQVRLHLFGGYPVPHMEVRITRPRAAGSPWQNFFR